MGINKSSGFNHIYEVDTFRKEFKALFGKDKSTIERYDAWLLRKLKILDGNGILATDGNRFEKIEDNIYSIRYPKSMHNPRVIYTILIDGSTVILLGAFLEHDSSDYKLAKEKARARVQRIKEELGL